MKKLIASVAVAACLMLPTGAMAGGMLKMESPYTVTVTLDRLAGVGQGRQPANQGFLVALDGSPISPAP